LGTVSGGEGVLGLQRAFQVAGVRTTATTLWSVSDAATAALVGRFYENRLGKRMAALEALREAQVWLLNERVKEEEGVLVKLKGNATRRTPPRYWAALVLAGDWR
jgi:CHAT domain-containing protein